jgi:catechol 2,3-dioxygenase-like lactoylglutathione lyase family enzyme
MFQVEDLDHVGLLVTDMERSVRWYRDVLGMDRSYQTVWNGGGNPVVMARGRVELALFPVQPGLRPPHHINEHVAIRVDPDNFAVARRELRDRGVPLKVMNHTISDSLYIFDPDGNQIEITTYMWDKSRSMGKVEP